MVVGALVPARDRVTVVCLVVRILCVQIIVDRSGHLLKIMGIPVELDVIGHYETSHYYISFSFVVKVTKLFVGLWMKVIRVVDCSLKKGVVVGNENFFGGCFPSQTYSFEQFFVVKHERVKIRSKMPYYIDLQVQHSHAVILYIHITMTQTMYSSSSTGFC